MPHGDKIRTAYAEHIPNDSLVGIWTLTLSISANTEQCGYIRHIFYYEAGKLS